MKELVNQIANLITMPNCRESLNIAPLENSMKLLVKIAKSKAQEQFYSILPFLKLSIELR